jgi:hypothetical protein
MVHHGPVFRAKEAAHPDYRAIQAWERAHISALVASARTRKPMRADASSRAPTQASAEADSSTQLALFDED